MKTLAAFIAVLGFVTTANAVIEDDAQREVLVSCENENLQVRVYNKENLKDAQLVVVNLSSENPGTILNETVRPLTTEAQDVQIYRSGNATLRVVPNADGLKGFLNIDNGEARIAQVLTCEMYYHILDPAAVQ